MVKSNPRKPLIDLYGPEQGILQIDVQGSASHPQGVDAIRKSFVQGAIVTLAPIVHRIMGEGDPWVNRPERVQVPSRGRFVRTETKGNRFVGAVGEMLVDVSGPFA